MDAYYDCVMQCLARKAIEALPPLSKELRVADGCSRRTFLNGANPVFARGEGGSVHILAPRRAVTAEQLVCALKKCDNLGMLGVLVSVGGSLVHISTWEHYVDVNTAVEQLARCRGLEEMHAWAERQASPRLALCLLWMIRTCAAAKTPPQTEEALFDALVAACSVPPRIERDCGWGFV